MEHPRLMSDSLLSLIFGPDIVHHQTAEAPRVAVRGDAGNLTQSEVTSRPRSAHRPAGSFEIGIRSGHIDGLAPDERPGRVEMGSNSATNRVKTSSGRERGDDSDREQEINEVDQSMRL